MSFEIFFSAYDHGKVATIPLAMIEEAFAPFIDSRQPEFGCWQLTNTLAEVWVGHDADCDCVLVSRPPGDERHPFWAALLEIMRKTQTVLYWPCVGPMPHCVVANEAVIAHMPEAMVKVVGTPAIVTRPEEFWDRIHDSGA